MSIPPKSFEEAMKMAQEAYIPRDVPSLPKTLPSLSPLEKLEDIQQRMRRLDKEKIIGKLRQTTLDEFQKNEIPRERLVNLEKKLYSRGWSEIEITDMMDVISELGSQEKKYELWRMEQELDGP